MADGDMANLEGDDIGSFGHEAGESLPKDRTRLGCAIGEEPARRLAYLPSWERGSCD